VDRPNGATEDLACEALVLACSGFGGNADMVRRYIPEMADALFSATPETQVMQSGGDRPSVLPCATWARIRATARSRRRTTF